MLFAVDWEGFNNMPVTVASGGFGDVLKITLLNRAFFIEFITLMARMRLT